MSNSNYFSNTLDPTSGLLTSQEFTDKLWTTIDSALARIDSQIASGDGLRGPGIYVGLSGVALMYFHLANQAVQGVEPPMTEIRASAKSEAVRLWNQKHLLETALDLVTNAEASSGYLRGRYTFHEGISGMYALKASILSHLGRSNEAKECIWALEDISKVVSCMKSGDCEILYGRCGYLLSLLFTQTHVGEGSVRKDIIAHIAKQVFEEGKSFAQANGMSHLGLLYAWHEKSYLGGAHGIAGILLMLFFCKAELLGACDETNTSAVLNLAASALLRTIHPSGNFPCALGDQTDALVQWCHGAPGFMPLLCHMAYNNDVVGSSPQSASLSLDYVDLAKQACECIWDRGLLTKGVGLCHGISGNAYAFLTLYRYEKDESYLNKARAFASFMMDSWEGLVNLPDRPASLYEGAAGAVCFMMDVINPDGSRFPGFEL